MELHPGQLITAPFLPALAEVKGFERRRGYVRVELLLQDGRNTYQVKNLTDAQLAQITILDSGKVALTEDAEDFFFLIEAHRIRLAYQFDPHLAVSISQVDPLPHQIEAVYHYVLESPRIRFLIADDPGAGKTIMAGLILKELQYRRLAQRVLIVAPGHLKYQWQREMKEKFQTTFGIVDRGRLDSAWGENVWKERDMLITSIDFIKRDEVRATLADVPWDLVIVDEAHKMSAYSYATRNTVKVNKTKRYQVGELLSQHTDHLLFLTATPHRGDDENFRLFLDLLRPGFFAETGLLRESIENKDNPVFIRRLKEDMKTFEGKPIFPPRYVHTAPFALAEDEKLLYNDVTRYVQDYYDKARNHRSISFALMILQRRLTSSTYAVLRSLKRRRDRLQELLRLPDLINQESEDYLRARNITPEELEDMSEEDRLRIEERLEHLTIAKNIKDVEAEIEQLDILIDQAEQVREQEIESKLVGLRDHVLRYLGDRKLLIFTEFRDTLDYLAGDGRDGRPLGKLREWGYTVTTIHGQMKMDDRIVAEHEFRDKTQILVATEAAGEGINLQFCSLMVNYDIPWNPTRLEQRMGRIHRYGQQYEVHVWNLISKDTREGMILNRLFEKLERMRAQLGSDRVFDIIGEIIPNTRLDDLIRDAIFNQRRIEEIEAAIDQVQASQVKATLEKVFMMSLATRYIDYLGIQRETLAAEENRLVPEYVADYFVRAFRKLGGAIEPVGDVWRVRNAPYELRRLGDAYDFKARYGLIHRDYRRVTFDKRYARAHPEAEFVAPGHPLLEAVNELWLSQGEGRREHYACFGDPSARRDGVLWFVEGEVADGRSESAGKRVFCLYHAREDGRVQQVNPAILWDLEPLPPENAPEDMKAMLGQRDVIDDYLVTEVLFAFLEEIQQRRDRDAHIKEKYGLRSLDYLISESNQKILEYQMRLDFGDQMDLPLLNERRNLERLQQRRQALEEEIRLERSLTINDPRLLGAALVVPLPTPVPDAEEALPEAEGVIRDEPKHGPGMRRDDLVEAMGMAVTMQYEKAHGWTPEDVSAENHGFDIRSMRYREDGMLADIRYIEVKARARSGAIRLSANEWKKARHFDDRFWLYIVTDAATDHPHLHRIHNPAALFREGEDIFASGFIIPEKKWRGTAGLIDER